VTHPTLSGADLRSALAAAGWSVVADRTGRIEVRRGAVHLAITQREQGWALLSQSPRTYVVVGTPEELAAALARFDSPAPGSATAPAPEPAPTSEAPMDRTALLEVILAAGLLVETAQHNQVVAHSRDGRLRLTATHRPISDPPSWRLHVASPGATWDGYVATAPEFTPLLRERMESVAELTGAGLATLALVPAGGIRA